MSETNGQDDRYTASVLKDEYIAAMCSAKILGVHISLARNSLKGSCYTSYLYIRISSKGYQSTAKSIDIAKTAHSYICLTKII